MFDLTRQIQLVSDAAKSGGARIAGVAAPAMPDTEATYGELKARIAKTVEFLESLKADQVNGREGAEVELPLPSGKLTFTARDFLFNFALPNFYFHVVTAYGLLRHQGVPLGKMDYLAGGRAPVAA
jgi:hypothetical protein